MTTPARIVGLIEREMPVGGGYSYRCREWIHSALEDSTLFSMATNDVAAVKECYNNEAFLADSERVAIASAILKGVSLMLLQRNRPDDAGEIDGSSRGSTVTDSGAGGGADGGRCGGHCRNKKGGHTKWHGRRRHHRRQKKQDGKEKVATTIGGGGGGGGSGGGVDEDKGERGQGRRHRHRHRYRHRDRDRDKDGEGHHEEHRTRHPRQHRDGYKGKHGHRRVVDIGDHQPVAPPATILHPNVAVLANDDHDDDDDDGGDPDRALGDGVAASASKVVGVAIEASLAAPNLGAGAGAGAGASAGAGAAVFGVAVAAGVPADLQKAAPILLRVPSTSSSSSSPSSSGSSSGSESDEQDAEGGAAAEAGDSDGSGERARQSVRYAAPPSLCVIEITHVSINSIAECDLERTVVGCAELHIWGDGTDPTVSSSQLNSPSVCLTIVVSGAHGCEADVHIFTAVSNRYYVVLRATFSDAVHCLDDVIVLVLKVVTPAATVTLDVAAPFGFALHGYESTGIFVYSLSATVAATDTALAPVANVKVGMRTISINNAPTVSTGGACRPACLFFLRNKLDVDTLSRLIRCSNLTIDVFHARANNPRFFSPISILVDARNADDDIHKPAWLTFFNPFCFKKQLSLFHSFLFF